MSLSLYIDGERWRTHLRRTLQATPGLVPVAKGNGYGFGNHRLARRAGWLSRQGEGCDCLAVGTYAELDDVASRFDGDLLVLTPWRPFVAVPEDRRLVHTVSRLEDLAELRSRPADDGPSAALTRTTRVPRVVLERATSMRRHGLSAQELREAAGMARSGGVRLEGVALHLPLATGRSHLAEVGRLLDDVVAAGLVGPSTGSRTESARLLQVWVSHLQAAELDELRGRWPDVAFRPRVGTGLWLGDREALHPRATVLDVHPVRRGDRFGYRGRSAPADGHLLVVSGGTAHGLGLEAPTGAPGLRARAGSLARGGLDAVGWVRSPFTIAGRQRFFAEPPHMQASMLFLPGRVDPPAIGDEVPVRVRYTTTRFDRVVVD